MKLIELLTKLNIPSNGVSEQINILGLSMDSRQLRDGYAFVAVQGECSHGLSYLKKAIAFGAQAIFSDRPLTADESKNINDSIPVIILPDDNKQSYTQLVTHFYQSTFDRLRHIYAVTGTNGKTTVAQILAQLLTLLGDKTATLGTAGNGFYGELEKAELTTMDNIAIAEAIKQYQQQGAVNISMEASSHGLVQGRLSALPVGTAILTNITQDHLDYHHTIEKYKQAKQQLFSDFTLQSAVINADCEFADEFIAIAKNHSQKVKTYSCLGSDADVRLVSIDHGVNDNNTMMNITYEVEHQTYKVVSQLLGDFNVENLLASITALYINGYPLSEINRVMTNVMPVAGRMQRIDFDVVDENKRDCPTVIVDFAHTPDALSRVLKSLKASLKNVMQSDAGAKLWIVFGCGGNRDKSKRPMMGKIAHALADKVVVTSDNPRDENGQDIINDIIAQLNEDVDMIPHREEAIFHAIQYANKNDIIVIAGKGHETGQIIGNQVIPFDDALMAKKALEVFWQ